MVSVSKVSTVGTVGTVSQSVRQIEVGHNSYLRVKTIDFLAEKNMLDCFIVPGGVDQEEPYHQV